MKKILIGLVFLVLAYFGIQYKVNAPNLENNFGVISIPDAPYLYIGNLQSSIDSSETTMTLTRGTLRDGTALSGYQCFTLDTGLSTAEYVCGTASSTSVTGLLRGIVPLNPSATSSALAFAHRKNADVRITDFQVLQTLKRLSNGQDAFPNPISYDSSIATSTLSGRNLVTADFVNFGLLQGAPTATSTTPGIIQLATGSQLSAGTAMSGVYTLVPPNSFFKSTPQSATTVPVTLASGKLAQGFFDLTASWAFSGAVTNSATTTFTGPTIFNTSTSTLFSSALTANATSTFNGPLISNGTTTIAGGLSGFNKFNSGTFTKDSSDATATTTLAHTLGTIPRRARVIAVNVTGSADVTQNRSETTFNGTTQSSVSFLKSSTGGGNTFLDTSFKLNSAVGGNSAFTTGTLSWDATNLYIGWAKTGSPTGVYTVLWEVEN